MLIILQYKYDQFQIRVRIKKRFSANIKSMTLFMILTRMLGLMKKFIYITTMKVINSYYGRAIICPNYFSKNKDYKMILISIL